MQLILESESTIDLKTKMSLSDDSVEKSVSNIMTGVLNGGIPNGDVTADINEAAKIIENKDDEKLEQIKKLALIDVNTISEQNGDTADNDTASNGSNSTDILNGNKVCDQNSNENCEPVAESNSKNENIEEENAIIEESSTGDKQSHESMANFDNPANDLNKDVSVSEVNNISPNFNVCDDTATEQIEPNPDNINENSSPCETENIKSEITDDTESVPKEPSNNIDSNVNSSDSLDIKQETEDTAVSDDMTSDVTGDSFLKKDIEETDSQEIDSESNPSISLQTPDDTVLAETNNIDIQSEMLKTESGDNDHVPGTVEADKTDIDTDENIDLIRLDANIDEVNESFVNETENAELNTVEEKENENLKTGDVSSMDVDENITSSEKDKNETVSITLASTTEIAETNGEAVLPIEDDVSDDAKKSDDLTVTLDDDNKLLTEETESSVTNSGSNEPILNQIEDKVIENVEKTPTEDQMAVDEIIDLDEPKSSQTSKSSDEERKCNKDKTATEDPKPIQPVLKLSNTLDILSDDDEEQDPKPSNIDTTDSKCINIEDDDDIMLIDDDNSGTESKSDPVNEQEVEKQVESKPKSPTENVKLTEDNQSIDKVEDVQRDAPVPNEEVTVPTSAPDISEKPEESKLDTEIKKPLIPENFLKTCKKNLADMTRDELEEFCILKLVESILDRSNLSEIKNKIKTLTQNLEEYKKKAMMLQKQNRDLQVVFKSVQEDVKKASDGPIVPLKITRSVGMQVLMADKPDKRRRPGPNMPNNVVNNNKPQRNPVPQGPRPQKPATQPIPVPRLVPANTPTKTPQQANTSKGSSPIPNGVKSVSPVQKGEKRSHNRIQSITVDLTDDEPPTKMVNRTGPMPPVRLVPSQNLLAAPRTPTVNSPRKVYIPISGPQGQNVRPGQTIMLKTVPTSGPRPRAGGPQMVRMPQSIRMTRPQGMRHPAPLPECMKQYQPPNWKALPPAPDLKLAKVENGIVISWKIEGYQEDSYEEIASYQLYAYQETTSPPNTALWKKIGDVKALPLPMACTLTQFMAGYKYYFAVRAVDIRSRLGPFSLPGSILLLNKM